MSAGGLDALEALLSQVPPASGLAFIVVQHMDPAYRCLLAELLQPATVMPVLEIADQMRIEPDHVYILPPSYDLSLHEARLRLRKLPARTGLHLPIDHFFRTLADNRRENAVGVILSGMGSDGTLGLRAIKERGGSVFAQAPDSARFRSMPRSAIDAGLVDVVALPEFLPERILAYLRHRSAPAAGRVTAGAAQAGGLERIVRLLHVHTGHDFSPYKKNTLHRRIERRMNLHRIRSISEYARHLRDNPHELELLFRELLIGVTRFFRDRGMWEQLEARVLPALLAERAEGGTLRAWVPGCSTGEEAYSLAILFCEALERLQPARPVALQIFATDLDNDAIERARSGVFPFSIRADVGDERLRRFFVEDEHGYRIRSEVREKITFAPHNLVMDPPFTRIDLLSCRNVLIYLEADLQRKLLSVFHYSLRDDGFLILGGAETVGNTTSRFTPLPGKTHVYQRVEADPTSDKHVPGYGRSLRFERPGAAGLPPAPSLAAPNLRALTENLLLQHYCPAAVLTNDVGDIIYVNGKTGRFLEPAAGKANLNVFAMAREGLSGMLDAAFFRALRSKQPTSLHGLSVGPSGRRRPVDVSLYPVADAGGQRAMMLIAFVEGRQPLAGCSGGPGLHEEGTRLSELLQCREELQATREEMQTSQEELKSLNEQLQSTKEALRSANEELISAKEEMQSMNEELQSVNLELNAKVEALLQAGDEIHNLLSNTPTAFLFLDEALRVRRYSRHITRIFKLLPGDAGRPITDLVSELDYPALAEDLDDVLRSRAVREAEVRASGGRWFRVQIGPYRTRGKRIDGVVLAFDDISLARRGQRAMDEALQTLRHGIDSAAEAENEAGSAVAYSGRLAAVLQRTRTILEDASQPMEARRLRGARDRDRA